MTALLELYGISTHTRADWAAIVEKENCPYLKRKCLKVRKSQPNVTIGSCSVLYGKAQTESIVICPYRFLERRQVFIDCIHLLSLHEPGNELHVVSEIPIPGGNVDHFLVSVRGSRVKDFVGLELQTLDTTGSVWPIRQRFLAQEGVITGDASSSLLNENVLPSQARVGYGMNWKMTAKTTLMQLHHKVETFEDINKHLVLVIQDHLLADMRTKFRFDHWNVARTGDPMHIHTYRLTPSVSHVWRIELDARLSTDASGLAASLGLQPSAHVELEQIIALLESRINADSLLTPMEMS